jgi:hypothetical protein
MSMDHLEAAVNDVSDSKWSWWPFLWLRPEKNEHLPLTRIALLSVLYGVPLSVLLELGIKLQYAASTPELVATALFFPLLMLVAGSAVVAPMWNRRAERLRARRAAGFGG